MASEVDICNLALGHLGDTAEVSSLTENSVQAQLCRRFYPMSRDAMLEMGTWGFATRRAVLPLLAALADTDSLGTQTIVNGIILGTWRYAYGMPASALNVLTVLPPDAPNDIETQCVTAPDRPWAAGYAPGPGSVLYTPQDYVTETNAQGVQILFTNQQGAVLRYTAKITDTTKFTPLFTLALTYLLASMLAGPILKGDAGRAEAKRLLQFAQTIEAQAEVSDSNQSQVTVQPSVPWIAGR